jgi:hypothetical protein
MRAEEERLILRKKRRELDDELRFLWSKSIGTEVAAGLTASEARRQASIEFGAVESNAISSALVQGWALAHRMRAMLHKSPSVTCAVGNTQAGRRTLLTQSFTAATTV